MKKNIVNKIEYSLCPEDIDRIASKVDEICLENKLDKRTKTRIRLSVEESLSLWMDNLGTGRRVVLEFGTRRFRPFFQISVEGAALNPYNIRSDEFGAGWNVLVSGRLRRRNRACFSS